MNFRRRSFRRGFKRRGPTPEVSQFSQTIELTVAAGTGSGSPSLATVQLLGQKALIGTGGGEPVYDPALKGLSIKEVLYDTSLVLTSPAAGVPDVAAFAQVGEAVFPDAYSFPNLPTVVPNHPPVWMFLGEVGDNASPLREVDAFPKRIMYRRWGLMPIGDLQISPNMPMSWVAPQTWHSTRIRGRVFLADEEALWAGLAATNPTVVDITLAWTVTGVVVYHARR